MLYAQTFLRLIAFLEAKRKKAEEEGLEPVPELSEEQMRDMTDEQLAAHLAAANAGHPNAGQSRDGSVCQSEESNPTSSSAPAQNGTSGRPTSEATTSGAPSLQEPIKEEKNSTDEPKAGQTQSSS